MPVVSNCHVLFSTVHETVTFQVLQLTALMMRSPATCGERFLISTDRVAITENEVRDVLLCLQDFVRSSHFTQRSFFSDSGLTMLSESVAITDSITSSSVYAPWSFLGKACASEVVSDLCVCCDRVVLRRRTAKDTSERWNQGGTPRNDTTSRPGVQPWKMGALSMSQLLRLLLVLLGLAIFVLPAASEREKFLGAP